MFISGIDDFARWVIWAHVYASSSEPGGRIWEMVRFFLQGVGFGWFAHRCRPVVAQGIRLSTVGVPIVGLIIVPAKPTRVIPVVIIVQVAI